MYRKRGPIMPFFFFFQDENRDQQIFHQINESALNYYADLNNQKIYFSPSAGVVEKDYDFCLKNQMYLGNTISKQFTYFLVKICPKRDIEKIEFPEPPLEKTAIYVLVGPWNTNKIKALAKKSKCIVLGSPFLLKYLNSHPDDLNLYSKLFDKDVQFHISYNEETEKFNNNETQMSLLKNAFRTKKSISIFLGTGVSVNYGAKSWNELLKTLGPERMESYSGLQSVFSDQYALAETAFLVCKKSAERDRKDEKDIYYSKLYKSLYENTQNEPLVSKTFLSLYDLKKHYQDIRLLTFNYDDFFEHYSLPNLGYRLMPTYGDKPFDKGKNVYHVHGYLPREAGLCKGVIDDSMKYIVLKETDNLSFYTSSSSVSKKRKSFFAAPQKAMFGALNNSTCIFIGLSFKDLFLRKMIRESSRRKIKKDKFAFYYLKSEIDDPDYIKRENSLVMFLAL